MTIDMLQSKMLDWIKKHQNEFGLYADGKISTMLALDTYKKTISSHMEKEDCFNIKAVIDNANMEFCGDLIQILRNWSIVKDYLQDKDIKSDIIDTLKAYFIDDHNRMDTIEQLQCFTFLNLDSDIIEKMVYNALLELSNVQYWKYILVQNPLYCRKIHNSFHYSSPYVLLYYLSKIQAKRSLLPSYAKVKLETIILDGYKNISQLDVLDASFLFAATPETYQHLVEQNIGCFISCIEQEKFCNIPFYYDNIQYGGFISAETYTAAMILEALETGGKFSWKHFVEKENSNKNASSQSNYLETVDVFHHPRICRMKMKEHCMAPYLDEGDEIDISYDFENTSINDILVFRHYDGRAMAHRVIDIISNGNKIAFITAADNGGLWGYPVFKRDIIGKVVNIFKNE